MAEWADALSPEDKAFLGTKGWDKHPDPQTALSAALTSYRAAESKLGVPADQIVKWPAQGGDMTPIHDRLGVPKTADEYKFEGVTDEPLVTTIRDVAFANKLTPAQAKAVADGLISAQTARKTAADGVAALAAQAEEIKLRAAWGGDYDVLNERVNLQLGKMVAWTPEMKAAFTSTAAGKQEILKLAVLDGEPRPHGLGGGNSGSTKINMSPEEAAAELRRKMDDKTWAAKWRAGDQTARDEFNALTQAQVRR